jgi:hypothetical protein
MLLAGDLFRAAGVELNDVEPLNEHVRWPVVDLAAYLTEAVAQASALKPTLFNSFVAVQLAPGVVQSVPGNFAALLDVLYNLNQAGTQTTPISFGGFTAARALGRPSCTATYSGAYEVRSATVHPDNDTYFYVDPPVPATPPYPSVWVLGQLAPTVITQASDSVVMANATPETYRAALLDWMLYRAFAKDVESADSFKRSQAHYTSFMQFLGFPPRDRDAVPMASAKGAKIGTPSQ